MCLSWTPEHTVTAAQGPKDSGRRGQVDIPATFSGTASIKHDVTLALRSSLLVEYVSSAGEGSPSSQFLLIESKHYNPGTTKTQTKSSFTSGRLLQTTDSEMPANAPILDEAKAKGQETVSSLKTRAAELQASIPTSRDELPSQDELKEKVEQAAKKSVSGLRSLAAGGVGGICAVVVGHPFDLVKVRMQTAEKGVYTGAIDVVKKTIAREGMVRGLYAGVSAPLVGVTPMFAVSFWGYDMGKKLVEATTTVPVKNNTPQYSIAQISAAGAFSAVPMTLITAPFERVKVLLQIQGQKQLAPGEKPKYAGGVDVVRQLYKEGGIKSVFRGSAMTLARDAPGSAAYFATYEYIKRSLSPKDAEGNATGELSLSAVLVAGASAGVAMWIPVFPVDTIKSRLQSAAGNPTIGGTIRELYAKGGIKSFFPGFGPALARAVPANAATFLGVELAHKAMNNMFG